MPTRTINISSANNIRDAIGTAGSTVGSFDFYLDESDTAAWHGIGARFEGIDLSNIASLTSAIITFELTDSNVDDNGANGLVEVRVEDSNNPAPYDTDANQPQDRIGNTLTPGAQVNLPAVSGGPHTRTYDVTSIVQELLDEGYTYDGTSGHEVMHFLFGGNLWFATGQTVSWRRLADRWSQASPTDYELEIIYEEGGATVEASADIDAPGAEVAATVEALVDVSAAISAPQADVAAEVDPVVDVAVDVDAPAATVAAEVTAVVEASVDIEAPGANVAAEVVPVVEVAADVDAPAAEVAADVSADSVVSVAVDAPGAQVAAEVEPSVDVGVVIVAPSAEVSAVISADGELSVSITAPGAQVGAVVDALARVQVAIEQAMADVAATVVPVVDLSAAIVGPMNELAAAVAVEADVQVSIEAPGVLVTATISDGVVRALGVARFAAVPMISGTFGVAAMITAKISAEPRGL